MTDYPEIVARFARDTAGHEMTVLHDQGLYRHLKCTTPDGSSFYRFDLITWPHNLMLRGDGMSFAFSIYPTEDWFDVVRRTTYKGSINAGYWSEKVTAGRGDIEDYSEALLKKEIDDTVRQWIAEAKGTPAERRSFERQLRAAVHGHFYGESTEYNTEYEEEAYRALHEFSFKPKGAPADAMPWQFADFHEWQLRDYSWQYLFACHAIVWGVTQWDAARKAVAA